MSACAEMAGGGLRLRFLRVEDRYRQLIEMQCESGFVPLLESREGTAHELWPPSPPLQDLHIEQRGRLQVAMLVGRAGKSHWSLSVALDSDSGELLFDAACRTGERPLWLGSSYHMHRELRGIEVETVDVGGPTDLARDDSSLMLVARLPMETERSTIRWSYRLRRSAGRGN